MSSFDVWLIWGLTVAKIFFKIKTHLVINDLKNRDHKGKINYFKTRWYGYQKIRLESLINAHLSVFRYFENRYVKKLENYFFNKLFTYKLLNHDLFWRNFFLAYISDLIFKKKLNEFDNYEKKNFKSFFKCVKEGF